MSLRPIVYLDSQDYSRFGDVLRGKADAAMEALFTALEARKQSGDAIFAVSMPVLGELLQYDADFRDTTLKKAEAVERLCGGWALSYPSRLVAAEIAMAAQRLGFVPASVDIGVLWADRYWYPNISDSFDGLKAKIQEALKTELTALPSRALRRRAAKEARKFDFYKAARDAAPEMAAEYGLPIEAITGSIVPLLRGTITSAQASRRLFASIAEPKKFVETYFEKVESDRSLPAWISKAGKDMHGHFVDLRAKLQPFMDQDFARTHLQTLLAERKGSFGRTIPGLATDDTDEFGVDAALRERFSAEPALAAEVQACEIVGAVVETYIGQIMGLSGTQAKIEHSFGGDLIHALYLPHVDLWRGDRRFSAVLKGAMPRYAHRVVSTLKELPAAIDAWQVTPA